MWLQMNISRNLNQPYGGLLLLEIFLQWLYKTSSDVTCHNPDIIFLSFSNILSHQTAIEKPQRLSTRKDHVLISMYDQTVTFLGDIYVTFCPNGATEVVNMVWIESFFKVV